MPFQIVELALDADDNVRDRKVVPYPYETREEAITNVESIISQYSSTGYDHKHDYWWARAANGDRIRFIIEGI